MIRPKLLLVFGLALLVVGLVQVREATVEAAAAGTGTAVIWDDQSLSDAITITMAGVTVPAADIAYEGWLVADDGSVKLSLGILSVASDGSVSHSFTSPDGENLIGLYDKLIITEEPIPDDDPGPSAIPLFSHQIPAAGMAHIRHLLVLWPQPDDSTSGILTNLKGQLDVAILHANLAKDSSTLAAVKNHLEHVINIIEGSDGANFGDLDGNGITENPGDGFGVVPQAQNRKHGPFAAGAAATDTVIVAGAALVDLTGRNAEDWSNLGRDIALTGLAQTTIEAAKVFVGPGASTVISSLEAARNGFDTDADGTIESIAGEAGAEQTYVEAQKMATYTLAIGGLPAATGQPPAPPPPPAAEPPAGGLGGLPAVGDSSIPWLAQLALVVGLMLLVAGGALVVVGRRSRSNA